MMSFVAVPHGPPVVHVNGFADMSWAALWDARAGHASRGQVDLSVISTIIRRWRS